MTRFVAAVTEQPFTPVGVSEGSHGLHRPALFVESLEVDRHIGGQFEVCRTVRLNRHSAKHAAAERLVADADVGIVRDARGLGKQLNDAQGFDGGPFRPGQLGIVDVHDRRGGGFVRATRQPVSLGLGGLNRDHRWPDAGFERNGIETRNLGIGVEMDPVPKAIEQVQAVMAFSWIVL